MKNTIYILLAVAGLFLASCTNEDPTPLDETAGLTLVKTITNDTQSIELYTKSGLLQTGYNRIYLRFKDLGSGAFVQPTAPGWMPVMDMTMMDHACPHSELSKVAGKDFLYTGYAVFQMPGNATESWNLTFNYLISGQPHTATGTIDVGSTVLKTVSVFTGSDTKKYIVALIEPAVPVVGLNDMVVGIYTMQSMMSFPAVADYSLLIDPRMPSMGNHGSPNNVDLSYNSADGLYHGTLSLTMTGLWQVNMILKDATDAILKGEEVTGPVESSSLYLEVEF